ncbi:unnamed protein product [Larinioides sclopetarius]|uniref:Uncharacterized protein n=1 Tax=Larinioides sclopetarius TaxID=280406 RepID=A0AAV2AQJ3_9ARAC
MEECLEETESSTKHVRRSEFHWENPADESVLESVESSTDSISENEPPLESIEDSMTKHEPPLESIIPEKDPPTEPAFPAIHAVVPILKIHMWNPLLLLIMPWNAILKIHLRNRFSC